jgi:hypothetical protein
LEGQAPPKLIFPAVLFETINSLFSTTPHTSNSIKMSNPNVFFDISIGGAPAGRVVMELFAGEQEWRLENGSIANFLVQTKYLRYLSTPPSETFLSSELIAVT